jgi:hypothetical protein
MPASTMWATMGPTTTAMHSISVTRGSTVGFEERQPLDLSSSCGG